MNIKPVSFGKTVKVFAPFHAARRIANGANGDPTVNSDVQKIIKEIFNDTDKGHALAFYFNENKNSGYIFSGKESKDYQRSLYRKALEVRATKARDPLPISLKKVLQSRYEHYKRTEDIINKSEEDFALRISANGDRVDILPRRK